MTNFKNVITDSIQETHGVGIGAYDQYVSTAAEAVQEREYEVFDEIVAIAVDKFSVSEGEVATILTDAGMSQRPAPEPEPETISPVNIGEGDSALRAEVNELKASIAKLTQLAERHGLLSA